MDEQAGDFCRGSAQPSRGPLRESCGSSEGDGQADRRPTVRCRWCPGLGLEGGREEGGRRGPLPASTPPTLINSRGGSRVRSSRCRTVGEGRRLRFNGGDPVSTGVGPSPGSSPASWFRLCLLLHFCSVAAVRAVETSPLKGTCVFRHLCSEGI